MSFSNDRVSAINLGDATLTSSDVSALLSSERGVRYQDAMHINLPGGEVWVFDYGVLVFWAVDEDERQALLHRLQLDDSPIEGARDEHFRFHTTGEEVRFSQDTITLVDDNLLTRLAISHALAQSLKLSEYEWQAQCTIQNHSDLPEALASTGKIALSRREIARIRGQLFSTKSDIILHYGLLDTPEFFWEYPELDNLYQIGAHYLELDQRTNILTLKLGTISELLEMLVDDQKHRHSSKLEWIIIWLIAVEIVIFLVNDFILA